MFWALSQNYQLFWKLFDYLEANCLRKFKSGIQILVGPAFLELLIETCKIVFAYNQKHFTDFLVWKGGVWEGCAPWETLKTLQFSNLICAIWCILFGNIPNQSKDHHLEDSPFSDNLSRIDIRSSINYRFYILTSQSFLCHRVFSGLFCLFFLSSCLLSLFFF